MGQPAPLQQGHPAPTFSFREANGASRSTSDLKGNPFVIYFYPKDDTPGCTKEACGFRDHYDAFTRRGVTVIGISPDGDESHHRFRNKFNLPFALASDEDHSISKAYGVFGPKTFMGRSYEGVHRVTFLVDAGGRIAKVYPKVKPEEHAQEILADLSSLTPP